MKIYDVFIAGCGIAGAAAALFAGKKGLSVYQAGSTAEIIFASGLIDVFDAEDPWQAIADLPVTDPRHPYALLTPETARAGLEAFLQHLGEKGLPYRNSKDKSCRVLTPMGALKRTWAVPESMWPGVEAVENLAPVLLVDFEGLREYSATQIAAVAQKRWPGLKPLRLAFPAPLPHPLLPGSMAQALEFPEHLEALADLIRPHIRDMACVGLPAILGNALPGSVHQRLQSLLGIPVFEIPTLPASVPGMRLKSVLESGMENVTPRRLIRALSVKPQENQYVISLGNQDIEDTILARHVILATGRFIGRGLRAEREGIREMVMDLPVAQPGDRREWHAKDLFDPKGHAVNKAGVMVNSRFQAVDAQGHVLYPGVRAVGTVLAHQDWIRQKCGAGLAVATAWAAIEDLVNDGKSC